MSQGIPEFREKVRRVSVVRPDNLGDAVLFSGALRHIRAHYPQAEITLCVKQCVKNLLELCPHVDRILLWEDMYFPPPWLPWVRGRERLELWVQYVMNLKSRADVLLLPVRSPYPHMHTLIQAIRAGEKYGIAGDLCNQSSEDDHSAEAIYSARLRLPPDRRREHEIFVTTDYLRFLGIEVTADDLWPEFWTEARDLQWAEKSIPQCRDTVTLAICPGVRSPRGKSYPAGNYARALSGLVKTHFVVVLFGSASDVSICEDVVQYLDWCKNVMSVVNLAGQSSIRQLVEGLRRCDAVLASDAAPLHIGVALGKPTVGIVGGGHYGRFYPWGNSIINRVANLSMNCYWCQWNCRYPSFRCIQEIPPELVARELQTALSLVGQGVDSRRREKSVTERKSSLSDDTAADNPRYGVARNE